MVMFEEQNSSITAKFDLIKKIVTKNNFGELTQYQTRYPTVHIAS